MSLLGYLLFFGGATPAGSGDAGPAPLAVGQPSASNVTQSTATLTSPSPTGGTAPYGVRWFRSGVPGQNGVIATGTGSTSLNYTAVGLTPGDTYYFSLRVVDAANNTIYGPQVTVTTLT